MCGTHACIARDRRVSKLEGRLSSACVNDLLIFRLSLQLLKNPDSGNGGLPPGPIHFACFDSRSAPISVRLIFSLSLKIHLRIGNFVCCRRNLCSSNRRRPCYLCGTHACIARDRRVSKMEGRLSSAYVNDLLIFRLLLQLSVARRLHRGTKGGTISRDSVRE